MNGWGVLLLMTGSIGMGDNGRSQQVVDGGGVSQRGWAGRWKMGVGGT